MHTGPTLCWRVSYERIGRRKAKEQSKVIDLRDPRVREEFLMREMTAANQKMMEGVCSTSYHGICVTFGGD